MLLSQSTRNGIRLVIALVTGLALVGCFPAPALAQDPLELELGGAGAVSWSIGNISPGDSGTQTVTLHNAGSVEGRVVVWLGDIISGEGANPESETGDTAEPGELVNYLVLNASSPRLSTNLSLPATVNHLPQSAADLNFIRISPLGAGETVTLVWAWEFRETGAPQNDACGDSLSFTINYTLEEIPSGSPGTGGVYYGGSGAEGGGGWPRIKTIAYDIFGKEVLIRASESGELLEPVVINDPEGRFRLEFRKGTKITGPGGEPISRIVVGVCQEPMAPPDGTEMIGLAYDVVGYIGDSVASSIILDRTAYLTLNYDPARLPENASSAFIAWYEAGKSWQKIGTAANSYVEMGEIASYIRHASTFAVFVELEPVEPSAVEFVPVAPEESTAVTPPQAGEKPNAPAQTIPGKTKITPAAGDDREPLRQASLGVAVTGVAVMIVLSYIQRRRRARS